MSLILEAAQFAKEAHKGQKRDYTGEPYINHPARVAARMAVSDGATDEQVAAAFLHDVVEDCEVPLSMIKEKFGDKVASLVEQLTNKFTSKAEPKMQRADRKRAEHGRLAGVSREARRIKLLDRLDNLRDLEPGSEFARVYIGESADLATRIGKDIPDLQGELVMLIRQARSAID